MYNLNVLIARDTSQAQHADFDETLQIHSAAKNIRHLFIVIGNCLRLEGENSTLT